MWTRWLALISAATLWCLLLSLWAKVLTKVKDLRGQPSIDSLDLSNPPPVTPAGDAFQLLSVRVSQGEKTRVTPSKTKY